MVKRIGYASGVSLEDLDWRPGEIVAFDNSDIADPPYFPLLLVVPNQRGLVRGHHSGGQRLKHHIGNGTIEYHTLFTDGPIMKLSAPRAKYSPLRSFSLGDPPSSSLTPNYTFDRPALVAPFFNPYPVEVALSGREAVTGYLQEMKRDGFDFYARCIEDGKLAIDRIGWLEKLLGKLGLTEIPRFRRLVSAH